MAWLIYALGGGWGHMQRGLALARRAAAQGVPVALLTNCRQQGQLLLPEAERWTRGVELLAVDPTLSKQETIWQIRTTLDSRPWEAVIVDTFPRGLAGELAEANGLKSVLRGLRVWVHRDLTPDYVAWANLAAVARNYDLILAPGEEAPLADLPQAVRTEPWLLADEHELFSRPAARARLGLAPDDARPVVLVSAAGLPEEQALFAGIAERLGTELDATAHVILAGAERSSTSVRAIAHWPLAELLRGVDLLVGAGGYHTVHEARAAGVPLVALPQPRLYDRQDRRLRPEERLSDPGLLAASVRARLSDPRPTRTGWPRGAEQGVEQILQQLRGPS